MNLMEQEAMKQSLVTSYVQYMRVSQRDTYGLAIPAARSCFYAQVSMALNVLICTLSREEANQLIQEWLEPYVPNVRSYVRETMLTAEDIGQ